MPRLVRVDPAEQRLLGILLEILVVRMGGQWFDGAGIPLCCSIMACPEGAFRAHAGEPSTCLEVIDQRCLDVAIFNLPGAVAPPFDLRTENQRAVAPELDVSPTELDHFAATHAG